MSGKNKHRSANDYLQYLKGELSSHERHAFEKGLEADPFEKEAMEGLETLKSEQVEQDILFLHNRLRKRLSRRRRVAFYSIAATVASLLIVGTVFLKIQNFNPSSDEKQVYSEEAFKSSAPIEDEPVTENQKEVTATDADSPDPEKMQEMPQAATMEEIKPARGETTGETYEYALEEKEQITHVEAEPQAMAIENRVARTTQKSGRQKKSNVQPVAQAPKEVSNELVRQEDLGQALTGQVSGVVISAEDQGPIPGAIVENRALNSGVFTDLDGRFDIAVQKDSPTTLVASFIGMETREYSVTGGTNVEIVLQPDPISLEEVMVVGHVSTQESYPASSTLVVKSDEKEGGSDYKVAEPSVGFRAYKDYIEEHIQFPKEDTETEKPVVVLKFKITSQGDISEVSALRSPGEIFSEEAIRLLKEGPSWNPASDENGPIDDWIRMRIVFKR
jgi:hypothetical protein